MSRLVVLLSVALVGCRGMPHQDRKAPPAPPKKDEAKAAVKLSEVEQAVIDASNAERKKVGLDPLAVDDKLMEAARGHAANMAKADKLDHTLDGQGVDARAKAAGYTFSRLGENIAWNQPKPKDAVAGWMDSTGHRENLLSQEYTQIGVAMAKNAKGEPYWVQVFGTPR
jgi:uncharacterized protein YkwD